MLPHNPNAPRGAESVAASCWDDTDGVERSGRRGRYRRGRCADWRAAGGEAQAPPKRNWACQGEGYAPGISA